TTAFGQPISYARVYLNDGQGNVRSAITNGFGYYRFQDVPAGMTFVAGVAAKGYTFEPITFTLGDELVDLDFTAQK
ncbi:MAG TPA: carboxypeptidase-like regulatory domain-containing protein, partial [Pyrinomonadaceae bacterium]|nr:carboxypeptidase-like regulatory domain-containing protein [Pyrinomonadaceae bacterium]